ncbi:MAG: hypothetical protein IKP28_02465 [Clostridia bacterium]|nr:hypothetical protein [Clostridia bacterium]
MNQILSEDLGNNKPSDIKSILRFFSIALIVFGLILVGMGLYRLIPALMPSTPVTTNPPAISVSVYEGSNLRVFVTHDKPLDKAVFSWDDGEEETILGRNEDHMERLIEIPEGGEKTFYIKVTDCMGVEAVFTNTYAYSEGEDVIEPEIELSTDGNQIKILAIDETEISYITYRWNDEQEVVINVADEESKTLITTSIDVPKGENELTVVAVDANNNTATKTKKCETRTRPVIQMPVQYGEELTITVTDEEGLDCVEFSVNGKKFRWESDTDDTKEWSYVITLEPGETDIIINAKNKAGIEAKKFHGRCEYNPQ